MNSSDFSIPVVILKLEHYGSLGICRSLGRLGVPLYGVDPNRHAPGLLSRFCRGRFSWSIDKSSGEDSLDYLLSRVAPAVGHPSILLPTSDETAIFVARYAKELGTRFIFPRLRPSLVETLCNKKAMLKLADGLGIPTLPTFFPRIRTEVLRYAREAKFPVILKGIDGGRLDRTKGRKYAVAQSEKDLLEAYDYLEDPERPNLGIQEYIRASDAAAWMFNGYFDKASECLASFTGKKLRQYPIAAGITSLGVCTRNDAVASLSVRFAKKIGYQGIIDLDFCFDERDGLYKLLDVNPRVGATFRLFVSDGDFDVVRAAYLDLTGQPVPEVRPVEGRRWVVEDKDLLSSLHYFREGGLSVMEWISSLRSIDETGYFSRDDMFPFIANWVNHLRRRIGGGRTGKP